MSQASPWQPATATPNWNNYNNFNPMTGEETVPRPPAFGNGAGGRYDQSNWKSSVKAVEQHKSGFNVITGDDTSPYWKPSVRQNDGYAADHTQMNVMTGQDYTGGTWKPSVKSSGDAYNAAHQQMNVMTGTELAPAWKPSVKSSGDSYHTAHQQMNVMTGEVMAPSWKPSVKSSGDNYNAAHQQMNVMTGEVYAPSWKPSIKKVDSRNNGGFDVMTGQDQGQSWRPCVQKVDAGPGRETFNVISGEENSAVQRKTSTRTVASYWEAHSGYNPMTGDDTRPPQWKSSVRQVSGAGEESTMSVHEQNVAQLRALRQDSLSR